MNGPSKRHLRIISPDDMAGWIIHEDAEAIALDKPAGVVCHPSKAGPWSSLAGAVREYFRLPAAHLVARLDRETSGVVVFAKDPDAARRLQGAVEKKQAVKTYLAIMTGDLREAVTVAQPLGPDAASPVAAKSAVRPDGQPAVTHFTPIARGGGFTLARAKIETGRKHQVRAHAQWLGLPLAGDKIYGPDERLFLEFIETGWTPALAAKLPLPRQALHCAEMDLSAAGDGLVFRAPFPADLRSFCEERGISTAAIDSR